MENAFASCFFSEVVMYMFDVEDKSNVAEDLSVEASSQVAGNKADEPQGNYIHPRSST